MSEDGSKKVEAVILLVSDMEKSVKFYRDVLRLPIKSQSEEWTEFFNSGTVIALHPSTSGTWCTAIPITDLPKTNYCKII